MTKSQTPNNNQYPCLPDACLPARQGQAGNNQISDHEVGY
jgi:hypothetical protein